MGIWMGALGRLTISPEPTRELIKEYLLFSAYSCPDSYREDDVAWNPFFLERTRSWSHTSGRELNLKYGITI